MSSNVLKQSTVREDFPKEAAFQHLFLNGLANFTTADCSICSELSKILPDVTSTVSGTIAGEIDFYLNGDLHWGIELLVNGDRIGEHIARFSSNGKYSALGAKDYVVVDFRHSNSGEPTNIEKHEKRVTVFFKTGDYSRAKCLFGFLEAVSIYLEQ